MDEILEFVTYALKCKIPGFIIPYRICAGWTIANCVASPKKKHAFLFNSEATYGLCVIAFQQMKCQNIEKCLNVTPCTAHQMRFTGQWLWMWMLVWYCCNFFFLYPNSRQFQSLVHCNAVNLGAFVVVELKPKNSFFKNVRFVQHFNETKMNFNRILNNNFEPFKFDAGYNFMSKFHGFSNEWANGFRKSYRY